VRHSFVFFLNPEQINADGVYFSTAESRHISAVLRLGRNDEISAVDGQGFLYRIILKERRADRWWGEIRSRRKHEPEPPVPLSLSLPCLKSNRWEILAEAACAMGVAEIWLTDFDNAAIRWSASRKERAEKKAVEALKQSGGSLLTRIEGPIPCRELLALPGFERILCADPEGGVLGEIRGVSLLLIGPEAGLNPKELELVQNAQIVRFNLGPRRLRSEIAGVCALGLVRSRLEIASI
jgi:16S rRNA (uracil1498-N3)-methyltransferase